MMIGLPQVVNVEINKPIPEINFTMYVISKNFKETRYFRCVADVNEYFNYKNIFMNKIAQMSFYNGRASHLVITNSLETIPCNKHVSHYTFADSTVSKEEIISLINREVIVEKLDFEITREED